MLYKIISIFFILLFIRVQAHTELHSKSVESSDKLILKKEEEKLSYRLPLYVVPKSYTITLTPYFDVPDESKKFTFDGSVLINLHIEKNVPEIILHRRELDFTFHNVILKKINYDDNGTKVEDDIQFSMDDDKQQDFVRIRRIDSTNLTEGTYDLEINKYSGILKDDMRGFYRSSYKNDKGDTVYLASTHFKPVGARRAFPCFDEPNFKATFNLTIHHPANYNVISNMPAIKAISSSKNTFFNVTLPMSTYLLAFVVSDFKSKGKEHFKVHTQPKDVEYGNLALETGEKLLKELETYTNITFNLPKMDQIAIPDFTAGAMENWGLVTYGEKSLLYNPKTSTTNEKQNIVETIAREFAHQWFGDLVSPKWWTFLWLNEGFANFLQSYITEQVEPKWQSIYQSVVKSIQTTAFDFDSSNKTHPIHQNVESPEEISAIFDSMSYQKGGAIIRMMQHFLGNNVFKRGLNIYLTKNRLQSTTSNDLFQALDDAANENNSSPKHKLETVMDTWVNRKGYPVVTVTRNYNGSKELTIEQERFFSYSAAEQNEEKYYWHIPINYATRKNQDFNNTSVEFWLTDSSGIVPLSIEPDEWVILNKQQTGFYRVNYDEKNWQLIIDYLNSDDRNRIHVLNRAQLVNDALAFVKGGSLTLGTLLNLTSYLANETDYVSWYPGFKSFAWIKERLANTDHYLSFKEYASNVTQKFVQSVGLEESAQDGHIDKLKRVQAIHWWCSLGNITCANYTKTKLEHWIDQPESNSISPDLKQVILCEGLRTASFDLWKKVFNRCLSLTNDDAKSYLTSALGCSNNRTIIQYYLNYTVEDNSKLNDTFAVARYIRDNSEVAVDAILDFTIDTFEILRLKYKDETRLSNLFNDVGEKITTEAQLDRLKATKQMDIPTRFTADGIQAAEKNIAWLQGNKQILTDWIEEIERKYGRNGGVATLNLHVGFILSLSFTLFIFTS